MPLYQIKKVSKTISIGIWKVTESIDELTLALQDKQFDLSTLPKVKNEQRLKEWLATRLLIHYFYPSYIIQYDEFGKPYLNNQHSISISHTTKYVAVLINKKAHCGIDIEKISSKITRIKHKFLNENDLLQYTSEKELTTLWSAKEALYKYYGKKEILFIEHLFIHNYNSSQNNFKGSIEINNQSISVKLQYEEIEGYILVYTC